MASQTFTAAQVLTAAQMNTLANTVDGYATTATAAGTTTLTVASYYQQFFTGSTTQTVLMPVASTLVVGWKIRVVNNSSGIVTVQSSGANTIYAVPAGGDVIFTCILASGTTAASWDYKNHVSSATTAAVTLIETKTLGTNTTTVTFSAIASTYTHLSIMYQTRLSASATNDTLGLRLNGDTGANYDRQRLYGNTATAYSTEANGSSWIAIGQNATANTAGAGLSSSGTVWIPNYKNTTFNKNILSLMHGQITQAASGMYEENVGGQWRSTSAVTSVSFFGPGGSDLMTGSVLSLYGWS